MYVHIHEAVLSVLPPLGAVAAGALRTLAFKNEQNKNQIVECKALPVLIQMLRSENVGVHYEAVGVIGNLVHSSQNIKKRVLQEGALQVGRLQHSGVSKQHLR